ncbi:hypothetical protein PSEUBRA_006008 [Kalmanozyma brasiliensis GHG001]|uniref:uncharacterized protein n=1 Tax=Kalmanozyma brasiliensis (strain GHG001) TaxID=1365824 RepID=UPI001CE90895|nr:uncharacterized protein PSEUBRA_006008 [Kalmanozyma brasiliensis GHG001]EST04725.2 hypothetical protein PSEUBRA_006008 [Kalmanozyma brasiliensis GHG001]
MPYPPRTGESASSIAFSLNPRDSRVVSIYDKYLYDPKDLESSDPRRRELARKASQLKLHGRPANDLDANGLRAAKPSNLAQRRDPVGAGSSKDQRPSRVSTHSQSHDRDSGAFGLGLGMLGGSDSESDSDSDDDRARSNRSGLDRLERSQDSQRPESWTDRAVAVGHRPPDSASQNPPSLKLLALKSSRQTSVLSSTSRDESHSRLAVDSNFVDRTSRHGSTIGFGAPTTDDEHLSKSVDSNNGAQRLSARTALTKQLGLITPNPVPSNRAPSPNQQAAPLDYFDSRAPNATQARSPPRNAGPPPIDVARAQQHGPSGPSGSQNSARGIPSPIDIARAQQHGTFGSQNSARGMPSPMGSQHGSVTTPNSATPFRSPAYGPGGLPSPHHHPLNQGPMPPNVLQRGPPSPYGQRGPMTPTGPGGPGAPNQQPYNNGPNRPAPNAAHPSSLQAGPGARPPQHPNNVQRGPGLQGQMNAAGRGPPGPNGQFGPSFSDAPGPSKRQSIFRRSMAMLGGGGPQAGPPGHGPGSHGAPRPQPGQKRQSLFRRSMAMLTGGGGPPHGTNGPPPQLPGQQMRMPVPAVPRASPAPRVQGLQDDFEKPDHPRKSQYLGAGGEGAEWDTNGEGAKFWRRFSIAQKTAGTDKVEAGSRTWMASMASGRRKLIVMSVIALVTLVGIIVGVIVWRETVAPSGSNSDEPTAINKANLTPDNGNSSGSSSINTGSTTRRANSAATSTASSNYSSRSLHADAIIDDVVKRHHRAIHDHGAPKMRRRHFGRAVAATPPQQQAGFAQVD